MMNCTAAGLEMSDDKASDFGHEVEHMEISDIEDVRQRKELAAKGEELERIESQYVIWQSMTMNKTVLLYGMVSVSRLLLYILMRL